MRERLASGHEFHELLQLLGRAALGAVLSLARDERMRLANHPVDDIGEEELGRAPFGVVEDVLNERAQQRARGKPVGADVGEVGDGILLTDFRDIPICVELQVGVQRGGALVDEVCTHACARRRRAVHGEHVGKVERIAIEAERPSAELGSRHVLEPNEDGLDGTACQAAELADADIDVGVLSVEV